MPRGRRKTSHAAAATASKGKRGRKHIFTPAQKRVLERMIGKALKAELRAVARGL